MQILLDVDGCEWEPFVNQFQQRMLRCVSGTRQGEERHDERLIASDGSRGYGPRVSSDTPMATAPRDPWRESIRGRRR